MNEKQLTNIKYFFMIICILTSSLFGALVGSTIESVLVMVLYITLYVLGFMSFAIVGLIIGSVADETTKSGRTK